NQHLHGEKFREHEMLARDIALFPTSWKMYLADCVRTFAVHQTGRGDWLPFWVWKLLQNPIDDAAQDALRKTFGRGIDGRDTPKMDLHLFIVLDHLELRMFHAYT